MWMSKNLLYENPYNITGVGMLTGLEEAPKFIQWVNIFQRCKLSTWRTYF